MNGTCKKVLLEYSPARRRGWRVRRWAFLGLLMGLGMTGWIYRAEMIAWARVRMDQRACLNYQRPADEVAYEADYELGKKLMERNGAYRMYRTNRPGLTTGPPTNWMLSGTVREIECWERLSKSAGIKRDFAFRSTAIQCATIFLHERRVPGKPPRLVCVELSGDRDVRCHVIALTSWSGFPSEIWSGCQGDPDEILHLLQYPDLFYWHPINRGVQIFAGQADAHDPAGFWFDVCIQSVSFRVTGKLNADETVTLKLPEAEWKIEEKIRLASENMRR